MKNEADLAREDFIKSIKNLGFPVNVQDREAYEKRSQGEEENSWAQKLKEQDKPVTVDFVDTNVISNHGKDDSHVTQNGIQGQQEEPGNERSTMEDKDKERLDKMERGYPGITSQIRYFEEAELPSCTHCGSNDTANVQIGIIGRTIAIAGMTRKFYLIANGPAPGKYFCRKCRQYFDGENGQGATN